MREKLHTTPLVTPEFESYRDRKARLRAAALIRKQDATARRAQEREKQHALRAEAHQAPLIPAPGEAGPAALRQHLRLRVPQHQDTSAVLQGLYPFLAEGGLGANGVFVGQDLYSGASFSYDPWELYARGIITAPNIILSGIVGSGKSSLAKSLYTRSLAFGRKVYVVGDPKGEHSHIARLVGGHAIELGHGRRARLNPLDEGYRAGGLSESEWQAQVNARRRDLLGALAETMLARPLSPVEHTAIDVGLRAAVAENSVPILPQVVDRILHPGTEDDRRLEEDGRQVGHGLRRLVNGDLAGLFDGPSTVAFDPNAPMVSIDLSQVAENSALLSVLMTCSSSWMESCLLDPAGGRRYLIYDEAWRLMSYPSLLKRMDSHWRLARALGIANLLIFHKASDLDNVGDAGSQMRALASSLLANAETTITYRQSSDQLDITGELLGLTGTERALLPTLGVGQGLWRIKQRSFVVQSQLHPDEFRMFQTDNRLLGKT
ncbi:ATP-binding protein [Leucobacter sp. UCD-THU]|uniref:hypothetical protein n=1 Tax=Leucobacter sp. UCD-THU TaxID=1292023 RepID=UPI000377D07C|nr:hypothetical protein [Leucobacter sp. UCD-THU]EYT56577.1 ATP-binding protein [Leucobacter sp. UCD-THU]